MATNALLSIGGRMPSSIFHKLVLLLDQIESVSLEEGGDEFRPEWPHALLDAVWQGDKLLHLYLEGDGSVIGRIRDLLQENAVTFDLLYEPGDGCNGSLEQGRADKVHETFVDVEHDPILFVSDVRHRYEHLWEYVEQAHGTDRELRQRVEAIGNLLPEGIDKLQPFSLYDQ